MLALPWQRERAMTRHLTRRKKAYFLPLLSTRLKRSIRSSLRLHSSALSSSKIWYRPLSYQKCFLRNCSRMIACKLLRIHSKRRRMHYPRSASARHRSLSSIKSTTVGEKGARSSAARGSAVYYSPRSAKVTTSYRWAWASETFGSCSRLQK